MSRLVIHVDTAATWRGGQNQVLLTAQGMAARGVRCEVACRAGGALEARARAAGLAVRPMPFRGDLWPPGILALARRLRQEPGARLLLHDPHGVSAGLVAARLGAPAPLVAVRRVDFPLSGPFSRAKYRACARVIVVSRAIGSVLEAAGVARARLRLVYEGVPDRRAQPGGRDALAELGVPAGAPVVGNVAALTDHKDHATLVEAMAPAARAPARGAARGPGRGRAARRARGAHARARARRPRGLRRLSARPRPSAAGVLRLLPVVAPRRARHQPARRDGLRAAGRGYVRRRDPGSGGGRRDRPAGGAARRAGPGGRARRGAGRRAHARATGAPRDEGAISSFSAPSGWWTRRCASWRRPREGEGDPQPDGGRLAAFGPARRRARPPALERLRPAGDRGARPRDGARASGGRGRRASSCSPWAATGRRTRWRAG